MPLRKGLYRVVRLAPGLGVLVGGVVLALLLSPWTWLPHPAERSPPTPWPVVLTAKAAHALRAGDLSLARRQLNEAIEADPVYPPALFLQSCLALEAGDLPVARAFLERLQAAAPEHLEPQLLQRLLEQRSLSPSQGWRQAFLRAWMDLGRPSFASSPLLLEKEPNSEDFIAADAWRNTPSGPLRLTLVLLSGPVLSEEHARWLMEQLSQLEDGALVQAVSVKLLARELPHALRAQTLSVVRQRLTWLVDASPGVAQPRLLLLWAQAPEWTALNPEELEALEALAEVPTWKATSFTQTFLDTRARLSAAGVAYPGVAAAELARLSTNTWGLVLLGQRAERTRTQLLGDSRRRLGRILWRFGARLRQDSMVFVRNTGLQFMQEGAADMGDEPERERAEKALEEVQALLDIADRAALERWPLPSLWEEVAEARARNEWAHVLEFSGAR